MLIAAKREQFALVHWLINDEETLTLFWKYFIKSKEKAPTKAWLWRVYLDLSTSEKKGWNVHDWSIISSFMDEKMNFRDVPSKIREAIISLRAMDSVEAIFNKKDAIGFCDRRMKMVSMWEYDIGQQSTWRSQKLLGEIFYVPSAHQIARKPLVISVGRKSSIWALAIPTSTVFLQRRGVCTLFIDCDSKKVIGSHVPGNHIRGKFKDKLGARIKELVEGKPATKRSEARRGKGPMASFGGYRNRFGKNKPRVNFFTYKRSFNKLLDANDGLASSFQAFLNRYAHLDLIELLLGCFMFYNPRVCREFLLANSCYLDDRDFESNQFDVQCRKRVAGIQMFISTDYASRIHIDKDHSSHSIGYVSSARQGECCRFFYASHGTILPLRDGDMFSFTGSLSHGTILERPCPQSATYVLALTTNGPLGKCIGL